MPIIYLPFKNFSFDNKHCFLSGEHINNEQPLSVFPEWIIQEYDLLNRPFKMLDESMVSYADIKLPVSVFTKNKLNVLEDKLKIALQEGYEGLCKIKEADLFMWAGKIVYGIIFKELQAAIKQQSASAEGFNMSQGLIHKFANLHQMLQALILPISFEEFKPWSIFLYKVNNPEGEFTYRDEINTLTFSLRMKDFGIVMNLQDNGVNQNYHKEICEKIKGQTLHPIQFEEMCARVFYSAYLFNRLPEYHTIQTSEGIFMDAMPLRGMSTKPIFDDWQNKIYGQVLENFWKRWGFLHLEIIKNPLQPLGFLLNGDGEIQNAEQIMLPL